MTPFLSPDRRAKRLEDLLCEQRHALREGRLDALSSLAPRLERSIAAMAPGLSPSQAARLRDLAAGNAQLLRAALAGLADVRRLRAGAHGTRLATYDASGRLDHQGRTGLTLSRR
jgi:hypothetical protein